MRIKRKCDLLMEFDHDLIQGYWDRYIAGYEEAPEHLEGLDDMILASWKRSKKSADPYASLPEVLTRKELEEAAQKNVRLIEIANPILLNLYRVVENTGHEILLADATGRQLRSVNDSSIKDFLDQANVVNGCIYTESVGGTNAISLCLHEDRPILLRGPQHYRKIYHSFVCYAVPIHSISGAIAGCISLTGPLASYQPNIMNALVLAGQSIENELRLTQNNALLEKVIRNIGEGVIILDGKSRIMQANDIARSLFSGVTLNDGKELRSLVRFDPRPALSAGSAAEVRDFSCDAIFGADRRVPLVLSVSSTEGIDSSREITILTFTDRRTSIRRTTVSAGFTARGSFEDLTGTSKAISALRESGKIAAHSASTVLIQGEPGTEKNLIAQAIHNASKRSKGPFITISCGSISKEQIKIELFGSDETASGGRKPGKIELAAGGTILLDEVENLSLETQVLLADYLQNRQGNSRHVNSDVRIISSTGIDLLQAVSAGQFRSDLFYLISVLNIAIPPLRERREDIRVLARSYAERSGRALNRRNLRIDAECMNALLNYNWPGNINELESVIERAVNVSSFSTLHLRDLPDYIIDQSLSLQYPGPQNASRSAAGSVSPEVREYTEIIRLLQKHHGHSKTVAQEMKMPLSTLYRKMNKYRINPKDYAVW